MPEIRGKWVPFWVNAWVCAGKCGQSAGLMWLWPSVCRDVLPGCRVNVWQSAGLRCRVAGLKSEGLPWHVAGLPGLMPVCRKAGWMVPGGCQEWLGTRGNPQFGGCRTGPGLCTHTGTGNGDSRKKFFCFVKSFSLFVIRDIPFLGCPVSFFDIPIWTDSGWPNKGFLQPMNTSNFG